MASILGSLMQPTRYTTWRPTWRLHLAHASLARGALHVDAGAVQAVSDRNASLLAAGIVRMSGDFVAGDPIDLVGPDGSAFARGLVNFDATELPRMLGRNSRELAVEMGVQYEREVVHRDSLMLLNHVGGLD